MTRDTRIGLLVGLLFILAFGLILSELTNPSPPLPPEDETRQEDDLTAYDHHRVVGQTDVRSVRPAGRESTEGSRETRRVADRREETHGDTFDLTARTDQSAGVRHYIVRRGDSLRKIARLMYGAGNEEDYRLIHEANKRQLLNESTIRVGQRLIIPPLPASSRGAQISEVPWRHEELDLDQAEQRFGTQHGQPARQRRYLVQAGDTLTSIARQQMGDDSPQTVRRLYQANRGWIADPNSVPVGVQLVIP